MTHGLLPYSYLPFWILISTPVLHLILFFVGFFFCFKRFLKRYLSIKEGNLFEDYWRGKMKKRFFYINQFFRYLILFFIFKYEVL